MTTTPRPIIEHKANGVRISAPRCYYGVCVCGYESEAAYSGVSAAGAIRRHVRDEAAKAGA